MRLTGMLPAVATLIVSAVGLSACFTTAADFQNDAETYILEDVDLREALLAGVDDRFVTVECDEPVNQDEGTTFDCIATDSDAERWEFEIEITSSNEYEVTPTRTPAD